MSSSLLSPLFTPVDEDRVLNILNTLYSIFLGFAFTQFIERTTHGDAVNVKLLLSRANIWPVALIATYYLLDWLSANLTVGFTNGLTHPLLLAFIAFVTFLGMTVAFSVAPTPGFYFAVFSYATVAPTWDAFVIKTEAMRSLPRLALVVSLNALRAGVGFTGLTILGLYCWTHPDAFHPSIETWVLMLFTVFVALKFVRYVAYLIIAVR